MSQLVIPKIECVESENNFGRFLAQPLGKDSGITLGNALRRVLLGYLPGAAVTWVKIEGIQHEFTPIPFLKEDTIEFLLNVKALRLKPVSGNAGMLVLDAAGKGRISAADIKSSSDFEIANPELYLTTLDSSKARLYVEFGIEVSEGYRDAESNDNLLVGAIPVDAIFTPIRKVNYTVEPIHMGRETNRERLSLDIWTDGTIVPSDAIRQAADILMKQLTPFANYTATPQVEEDQQVRLSIPDEKYNMPVDQLDLSVRTMNCLRRGGISTLEELISRSEQELMSLRNFGQKSKQELEERLAALGLSLFQQVEAKITEEEESVQQEETKDQP